MAAQFADAVVNGELFWLAWIISIPFRSKTEMSSGK
jgi:hypothetical protein